MTFVPCPMCGGMLEGDAGAPCANSTCLNSRRGRELRASTSGLPVDVSAALSTLPGSAHLGPNRKERRRAKRQRRHGRPR